MERKGPLKNLRVIEFCNVIAGPFCGSLMADYGADVIKVEMPGKGDSVRQFLPWHEGKSVRFPTMGRNKRFVTLDLHSPSGKEIFKELIKDADCVVENFRPGTMEKWGIGYDTLSQINPKLVMVRISGYGQTGPYRNKPGFGMPATAFSGLTALQGYADRAPVSPPISLADFMAGIYGFIGAASAILAIKTGATDKGQIIDVSLYEPLIRMMEAVITEYPLNGRKEKREPYPTGGASPSNIFGTSDNKWVIMAAANQNTWERIPSLIGMPELLDDPRFASNKDRVEHDEELLTIIRSWTKKHTMKELVAMFSEADVPASPVNEIEDLLNDPQVISRESIIKMPDCSFGEVTIPNIFPRFSGTPCEVRYTGRPIGSDNESVYVDEMRISPERFNELIKDGVI